MLKIGVVCSVNGRSGVGGIIVTFGTSTVSSLRVNAASSLEGEGEGEVVGPIDLSKGPIDAPPNRRSSWSEKSGFSKMLVIIIFVLFFFDSVSLESM